jgi:hypothetical protein
MGPETSLRYPLHPVKVTRGRLYIILPMIITSLYVMIFDACDPLLGQVGGGWALEISLAYWLDAQKSLHF